MAVLLNEYNIIDFFLSDDTDPIASGIKHLIKFNNNMVIYYNIHNSDFENGAISLCSKGSIKKVKMLRSKTNLLNLIPTSIFYNNSAKLLELDCLKLHSPKFISFPIIFLTLGLFSFILNLIAFYTLDQLLTGLEFNSILAIILTSIVISSINMLSNVFLE